MHTTRHLALAMIAVAVPPGSSALAAQQSGIRTIPLSGGAKELDEPFTAVAQVVELKNGKLVVLDNGEKELRLADLSTGTVQPIGRQGGGPLEYRTPGALLSGASDTVWYYDIAQGRMLLISPAGAPARVVTLGQGDAMAMFSRMQPAAVDARGRLYGQTLGMSFTSAGKNQPPTGMKFADSVAIEMLDPGSGKTTQLAMIRNPARQSEPKLAMEGTKVSVAMTAPNFEAADAWGVLPDGRLVILRDGVYRLHLLTPGKPDLIGPSIPYNRLPVTAAERKDLMDSLRSMMDSILKQVRGTMASVAQGSGKQPSLDFQILEPKQWAEQKPAYSGLLIAPDGRVWVGLTRPTGSRDSWYDILDATGRRLAQVHLNPGERLVGLGRGTVYTVRKDEDDLQYVRKYVLPVVQ